MAEGKTIGAWLSGNDLERAEARAKKIAKGNNSSYVKKLILADLEGSGPSISEGKEVIISLARHYHPTLADVLAQQLTLGDGKKPSNQARVIVRFLEALNKALEGDMNPENAFELADASRVETWEGVNEDRLETLAAKLAQHMKSPQAYPSIDQPEDPAKPPLNIDEISPLEAPAGKSKKTYQPPDGRTLIRSATSKRPASSSQSKAS